MTTLTEKIKIPIADKILKLTAVFIPDETVGGYTGFFKELPGCITEGNTIKEVKIRLLGIVEEYLEVMARL